MQATTDDDDNDDSASSHGPFDALAEIPILVAVTHQDGGPVAEMHGRYSIEETWCRRKAPSGCDPAPEFGVMAMNNTDEMGCGDAPSSSSGFVAGDVLADNAAITSIQTQVRCR